MKNKSTKPTFSTTIHETDMVNSRHTKKWKTGIINDTG